MLVIERPRKRIGDARRLRSAYTGSSNSLEATNTLNSHVHIPYKLHTIFVIADIDGQCLKWAVTCRSDHQSQPTRVWWCGRTTCRTHCLGIAGTHHCTCRRSEATGPGGRPRAKSLQSSPSQPPFPARLSTTRPRWIGRLVIIIRVRILRDTQLKLT